ncbi:MAG: peptidylprolyl isomerase [Burkholderiales bacterium]
MSHSRIVRWALVLAISTAPATLLAQPAQPAQATQSPDTVLVSNSLAKVTRADYDAELLKLPPDLREGFANNPRRVNELLQRMLVQKSLAAEARNAGLEKRPDVKARLDLEVEKFLSTVQIEAIDAAATAEFNANLAKYETRARELYMVDKAAFTTPAQVSATHILFDSRKRGSEAARQLAVETRAKIAAGADMGKLAREISDDPSSSQNQGALGWFSQKDMDPAFATAAFALVNVGDLSEPVQSQFGWHIIRLDGKRPGALKPYPEARDQILAELRKRAIEERREAAVNAIRRDPQASINREAVGALTPQIDPEVVRRAQEAAVSVTAPQPAPK